MTRSPRARRRRGPGARPGLALTGLLAAALGAGCGAPGPADVAAPPASATAATAGRTPAGLSGTDTAWLYLAIAMDEAAVPLLDLAPTHSADAGVRRLAADLRAAHLEALAALRGLRDAAGLPAANPHAGHRMPGMVTPEQVQAAARARGAAFDALLREALLAHLDQSVRVAAGARAGGADAAVRAWAQRIAGDRAAVRGAVARIG